MNKLLYTILDEAKNGNENSLNELITKFEPAINKFSRELGYDCAKTDLKIFIIKMVRVIDLSKFESKQEGKIVNYIYNAIKNEKINLFRKHLKNKIEGLPIKLDQIPSYDYDIDKNLLISEYWKLLTKYQKTILKKKYFEVYSDAEISKDLGVSRQAINRCKNRAFSKLRESLILV